MGVLILFLALQSPGSTVTPNDMVGFWHSVDCIPAGIGEALFLFADGRYYYHVPPGFSCILGATGTWRLTDDGRELELSEQRLVFVSGDGNGFGVLASPACPVTVFRFNGEIVRIEGERPFMTDMLSMTLWKLMNDPGEALSLYVSDEIYGVLFNDGGSH